MGNNSACCGGVHKGAAVSRAVKATRRLWIDVLSRSRLFSLYLRPPPPSTNVPYADLQKHQFYGWKIVLPLGLSQQATTQSDLQPKAQLPAIQMRISYKTYIALTNDCYSLMGYCIGASSMQGKGVMFLRVGKFMFS